MHNFLGRQAIYGYVGFLFVMLPLVSMESSRFLTLPLSQTVVEGESVLFECSATPKDLEISWTLNGQAINNSTRIHQVGSNMRIDDVSQDNDAGDYVCIATSKASGARQAAPPARLSIIWIRSATVQLLSSNRNEALLKCHVEGSSGDGMLEIEWFRNSEKLSSLKNIELQENRLIIRQPSEADNGLYRCIAANAAGRVMSKKGYLLKWSPQASNENEDLKFASSCIPRLKKNQKLSQHSLNQIFLCRNKRGGAGSGAGGVMPEAALNLPTADASITQGPSGKKVINELELVELPCAYQLSPKYAQTNVAVKLKWRKDGKLFRQIELNEAAVGAATTAEPNKDLLVREDARVNIAAQNGSLIFSEVIASDAGQYLCQVVVEGHSAISSTVAELQIIEQLKFSPQPTSKLLELGSVGKVHCKAQGTPMPQVKWIKDMNSAQLPETIDDINGTLIFRNVTAEHRGNYTCMASNSQGSINATVSVTVVVAPRFSVKPEGPIETAEGGYVALHCQAIGDPLPNIKWDKDTELLNENNTDKNRFHIMENGTLEIRDVHVDDEGRYSCTIGNSAGFKRQEVHLIVKASDAFDTEESHDGFLITRAVLITVSVAFAYIILVVGLMIWCRFRRQARKARLNEADKDNVENGEAGKNAENEPCLPDDKSKISHKSKRANGSHAAARTGSGNEAQKSDDTACSNHSKASKKSHAYDQLSLARSSISELIQIGRGEFGDVFVGKIKSCSIKQSETEKDADNEKQENGGVVGLSVSSEKRRSKTSMNNIEEISEEDKEENDEVPNANKESGEFKLILVKALNKLKDENACQEFKRQIEMFRAISHKGVVRLFGLCREKDPHYLVLEYTDWGDLKQFLLATAGKVNTSTNSSSPPPLKIGQVLTVAYQIARGMDAIYRARFIHRDLATRNCVISSDFVVKVSYPALCKDKYSREYFKHRNSLLPIRWLAPECIQEDEYTTKSDIFAFGVVVWELFNQATKIPFEELSNEEIIQRSLTGKLEWTCAEDTPECLKETLLACWNSNPKERPSFSQICSALSKAMQNGDK